MPLKPASRSFGHASHSCRPPDAVRKGHCVDLVKLCTHRPYCSGWIRTRICRLLRGRSAIELRSTCPSHETILFKGLTPGGETKKTKEIPPGGAGPPGYPNMSLSSGVDSCVGPTPASTGSAFTFVGAASAFSAGCAALLLGRALAAGFLTATGHGVPPSRLMFKRCEFLRRHGSLCPSCACGVRFYFLPEPET